MTLVVMVTTPLRAAEKCLSDIKVDFSYLLLTGYHTGILSNADDFDVVARCMDSIIYIYIGADDAREKKAREKGQGGRIQGKMH